MDWVTSFLGRNGFLPHGYCFTWSPSVLWSMVGADTVIAASYFSIPIAVVSFIRKRPDLMWRGVAWLFSAFIFACGLTHVMDVWTIWQPDYGLQALTKVATAAVSLATAVALWPLMPRALQIPSKRRYSEVVGTLQHESAQRRLAEERLADIQQSLAATLSSIGAGFIATDREGRVTRINPVAERVLGWSRDDAVGESLWRVFAREGRSAEDEAKNPVDLLAALGFGAEVAHHVTAIARDGRRTAIELKAALTHADDGAIRGLVLVFRDLTQLMLAEADSGRLAAIVESSADAIIGKTLEGRITSWNRGAQDLFGYSADEAIGQAVQMLIPPDREAEEMRILAELARGHQVPAFDTVRRHKSGRLIEVSIGISPIRDARGDIVGASKIARDMTQQRRAEAALRDSEARLRFTLESAQIGDWELDFESGQTRRSLRHARCFGYDSVPEAWSFETFIDHIHPDDRAEVRRLFERSVRELSDWAFECRVLWRDGSMHWIHVHAHIGQRDGRATRAQGIIFDVTQRKQDEESRLMAQRLEAENRQIQEASRLKSQFLANMSHELRTPLNAIIGFADLLHKGVVPANSPKHRDFLGHIGSSGRHLLQLINDVLDLSKVESGKFEFYPEPIEMPRLVDEVLGVLHTAVQRKTLQVATEIDPTLDDVVLDPARLKQVLYNYLSNAIKFTAAGGRIAVRVQAEGPAHLRIEVEDSGIGIAAENLPRLFAEFQQLDSGFNKQHEGTGLGLALTRRLVQAQGGSVGVRSLLGAGSVFHAVLPRVQAAAGAPDGAAQPAQQTPQVQSLPALRRVLIVEGDATHQARVVRALADAGFLVDVAATGEQALAQARAYAYSGISLDLMLPDQAGLGVLEHIRSGGASRESPVFGVSMPIEPAASGAWVNFPIADVLGKPIRTAEVMNAVARLRRQQPELSQVLVIDDDPLALDLMRATLAGLGVEVTTHQDGREALRELDRIRPDAIVLDLMMPGFDGFAVLDALRRMPAWQHLPVFIWSAMQLSESELAGLARSASAIIGKGGGDLQPLVEGLRRWRIFDEER